MNQEPFTLATGVTKGWATESLNARYQYLRHMYTCLYEVSSSGGTCIDPMFFYYPTDDQVYPDTTSFMVGGALKVSPVV